MIIGLKMDWRFFGVLTEKSLIKSDKFVEKYKVKILKVCETFHTCYLGGKLRDQRRISDFGVLINTIFHQIVDDCRKLQCKFLIFSQ